MKILLFQRLITHYRASFFNQLYEHLGIVVCHSREKKEATLRDCGDTLDFPHERLPRVYFSKKSTFMVQNILPPLLKYRPEIIIFEASFGYLSMWMLLFLRPIFKYKMIAWTHGIRNKEILNPFSSFKSKIMLKVFDNIDGTIFYSEKRKFIAKQYLKKNRNLVVAQNTIDTTHLLDLYEKFMKTGKDTIKRHLNISYDVNFVFIGRLTAGKRIDLLLEAFECISNKYEVGLHIIGDGPEKNRVLRKMAKHPENIFYYGAVYDDELKGKILFISDLNLNPGFVGLSIIDSFCFGTPMLTFKSNKLGPFHSPEVEYLVNGYNGLLVENETLLEQAVENCIENRHFLYMLSCNALKTARSLTIQHMVFQFGNVLSNASKNFRDYK